MQTMGQSFSLYPELLQVIKWAFDAEFAWITFFLFDCKAERCWTILIYRNFCRALSHFDTTSWIWWWALIWEWNFQDRIRGAYRQKSKTALWLGVEIFFCRRRKVYLMNALKILKLILISTNSMEHFPDFHYPRIIIFIDLISFSKLYNRNNWVLFRFSSSLSSYSPLPKLKNLLMRLYPNLVYLQEEDLLVLNYWLFISRTLNDGTRTSSISECS